MSQADRQGLDLPNSARQGGRQVKAFPLLIPEDGVGFRILTKAYLLLMKVTQPLQTPVASVSHIQASWRKWLLREWPTQFMHPTCRQPRSDELPAFEIPADGQLERRFAVFLLLRTSSPAALPLLFELC